MELSRDASVVVDWPNLPTIGRFLTGLDVVVAVGRNVNGLGDLKRFRNGFLVVELTSSSDSALTLGMELKCL